MTSLNIAIDPANASTSSQGALPDGVYQMKIVDAVDADTTRRQHTSDNFRKVMTLSQR